MIDLETKLKDNIHRWLTPKAGSFDSKKHGLGIKVIERILEGEDVLVYGGIIINSDQIEEYWKKMGHIGTQIDDNFFIVPSTREEIESTGTINHSCNPNTGFKNQVQLVATREIEPGEELTLDYAYCETSHNMDFKCECGDELCRGRVTNNDWQDKKLQEKFGRYFSPYIQKKFR